MASPWTEFLVEALIVVTLVAALPFAIMGSKKHIRGRMGGAAMMIGLAFGSLFDPAAARSAEIVRKKSEEAEADANGAPPGEE
jgi:hypothetical protein